MSEIISEFQKLFFCKTFHASTIEKQTRNHYPNAALYDSLATERANEINRGRRRCLAIITIKKDLIRKIRDGSAFRFH